MILQVSGHCICHTCKGHNLLDPVYGNILMPSIYTIIMILYISNVLSDVVFCKYVLYISLLSPRAILYQRPSLQLNPQCPTPRVISGSLCGSFAHLPLCCWPTSRRGSRSDELYTHCANLPLCGCGTEKLGLVGQTMWYHFQQPISLYWFLCTASLYRIVYVQENEM